MHVCQNFSTTVFFSINHTSCFDHSLVHSCDSSIFKLFLYSCHYSAIRIPYHSDSFRSKIQTYTHISGGDKQVLTLPGIYIIPCILNFCHLFSDFFRPAESKSKVEIPDFQKCTMVDQFFGFASSVLDSPSCI